MFLRCAVRIPFGNDLACQTVEPPARLPLNVSTPSSPHYIHSLDIRTRIAFTKQLENQPSNLSRSSSFNRCNKASIVYVLRLLSSSRYRNQHLDLFHLFGFRKYCLPSL